MSSKPPRSFRQGQTPSPDMFLDIHIVRAGTIPYTHSYLFFLRLRSCKLLAHLVCPGKHTGSHHEAQQYLFDGFASHRQHGSSVECLRAFVGRWMSVMRAVSRALQPWGKSVQYPRSDRQQLHAECEELLFGCCTFWTGEKW